MTAIRIVVTVADFQRRNHATRAQLPPTDVVAHLQMRSSHRPRALFACIGLILTTAGSLGPVHAQPTSVSIARSITTAIVLAHVAQHYATTTETSAAFRRTLIDASGVPFAHEDGMVWTAPGVFRFEYMRMHGRRARVSHSEIFDGQMLWSIDHDSKTITTGPLQPGNAESLSLILITRNRQLASFTAMVSPGAYADEILLELEPTPLQATPLKLSFSIATSNWRVREATIVYATGITDRIQFFMQDHASTLRARHFQVSPAALPRYTVVTSPRPGRP